MDNFEAKCKVCLKAFDVSNMGESALKSHKKGKKHIYLMETQHLLWRSWSWSLPTNNSTQLDYKKVDVGFVAQQMLKEKC